MAMGVSPEEVGKCSAGPAKELLSPRRLALPNATVFSKARELQQMVEALESHYEVELQRISPSWTCAGDSPHQPPFDVAEEMGVPGVVLGAILAGKCRDQRIPVNNERQKRFAEWLHTHCASIWFTMHEGGIGPESAKGIVLALSLNDRFTSLNLACNVLSDAGAAAVAKALPEHQTLVHLDLSANDIGHNGANALFEALVRNRSVTSLDLSSKPGSLRNRLARHNAQMLERLLIENQVLAKLVFAGTNMGPEACVGLARGLIGNKSLTCLDLSGCDLGPRGAAALADALLSSAVEELSLADNKMGDEGLVVLAARLGAPPVEGGPGALQGTIGTTMMMVNALADVPVTLEGTEAVAKYHETLSLVRRSIIDLHPSVLNMKDADHRRDALARVQANVTQLAAAIERPAHLPKLRVLCLANNGATTVGIGRVEDALQANYRLERLVLDHSDHRLSDVGARSLVSALPVNRTLRHLSLAHCRLGTAGIIELCKALSLNQALESLSLRGNEFGQGAALALGGLLGAGPQVLRALNLSACHLSDEVGVYIAQGLANNTSVEVLQLRDNCLREGTGRALVDSLRKHTALTQLTLELNGIDFRFLAQINQLLERNGRIREKGKPQHYRQRIGELEECQREVQALTNTLQRSHVKKRRLKLLQAAAVQEYLDAQGDEKVKMAALEERMETVRQDRHQIDEEIESLEAKLRAVSSDGEYEASQLSARIAAVEERIRQHERHIDQTRGRLEAFEERAGKELATAREELDKAEKARSSAALLAAAAQRNLDSFTASLKSIEEGIPGAGDPRRRRVERKVVGEAGRRRAASGGSRPRTPSRTATPAASPSRPRTPGRLDSKGPAVAGSSRAAPAPEGGVAAGKEEDASKSLGPSADANDATASESLADKEAEPVAAAAPPAQPKDVPGRQKRPRSRSGTGKSAGAGKAAPRRLEDQQQDKDLAAKP